MKSVGVGKSGAKNLNRVDAAAAMEALLSGQFHPVTFGAFFMALRYKGETPEELAGFTDAIKATSLSVPVSPPPGLLNCAGAYDGKARTCNIGVTAALVTAAAGVPIALHGARNIPTKAGMTTSHVLEALGVNINRSAADVAGDLHSVGIGYIEQVNFQPGLDALLPARIQMGKRTIINTAETLSNPFGATSHLGGFFHDAYAELICRSLQFEGAPFNRVVLVKGIEGSDELRPGSVFVAQLVDNQYSVVPVDSEALGYPVHISDLSAPTDSVQARTEASVRRILELLDSPAQPSAFRSSVIVNGAVRLYAAGKVPSIAEGSALAEESLASGAAADVLSRWKSQSWTVNQHTPA